MKIRRFLSVMMFMTMSIVCFSAPDCSKCTDEEYVTLNYSGDVDACEAAECQDFVPINDYSYILVFLGGMLAVGMFFKGRKLKNIY